MSQAEQKRPSFRESSHTHTCTSGMKWYDNPNLVSKTSDGSTITLRKNSRFTIKLNRGVSSKSSSNPKINTNTKDDDTATETDTMSSTTSTTSEPPEEEHSQVITLLKGTQWYAPRLGAQRHVNLPLNSLDHPLEGLPSTPSRFEGYNWRESANLDIGNLDYWGPVEE
ncbi:hypothetical protein I302_106477 [Kwoniella bestiolae CBS 10118]|uniref:Uncharacterized protein n=1 Tax=Kwoniella bestiolae CBS 10118 TaxID=1296100 RepID=A0A1B9G1A9_9TREE|nr:hypothetical protein I302_06266 [Kwoniella bestiolae CBS 10118]OCF24805.1 hypothetical protein I302_06266 [Kwoniella bestiolae CBS 10118]